MIARHKSISDLELESVILEEMLVMPEEEEDDAQAREDATRVRKEEIMHAMALDYISDDDIGAQRQRKRPRNWGVW